MGTPKGTEPWNNRAASDRQQPAPSGDLAGLVERLGKFAKECRANGQSPRPVFAVSKYRELADDLDRILAAITTLSERLVAAENDAAAWKADAGATHLKLVAAEAERDVARAWSAGRAADIVTLGAALGAAEAQVKALKGALNSVRELGDSVEEYYTHEDGPDVLLTHDGRRITGDAADCVCELVRAIMEVGNQASRLISTEEDAS